MASLGTYSLIYNLRQAVTYKLKRNIIIVIVTMDQSRVLLQR